MLPLCALAQLLNKEGCGSIVVMDPIWILIDLKGHIEEVLLTGSSEDDSALAAHVAGKSEQPSLHGFF